MFNFVRKVADINKDLESLMNSCSDGSVILSTHDNMFYAKTGEVFSKIGKYSEINNINTQSTSIKEMKVYKCPNCNNSIHYLQAKCEFCGTKISWI